MKSNEMNKIILIRLFPDEDVNEQIKKACRLHEVKTAVILSGIGQLKQAQLGFFKEKDDYTPETFNKPLEILSLSGNICKHNKDYILHLHIVLGDKKKNTVGGHFLEGKISITGEIVLLKTSINFYRKLDNKTGLKDLVIK
jgi:predicted DNA-binding protein with PD1-like motif